MDLIGRDADVEGIERALACRLVTVVGAGGVGKSMVASHVLERWRSSGGESSAVWVDLGWVTSADDIAVAWARALGPTVQSHASMIEAIDRRGPVLLVVDNCEHVTKLIAPIVEEIATTCDSARILATSRDSLGLAGERLWRLSGLACPPAEATLSRPAEFAALRLFLDRAIQVRPSMSLDERTLTDVGETCRLLDGNPLGLILAAGHLRAMSPSDLLASVAASNVLVGRHSADVGSRQASIDASLRWSFDLLEPAERDVFVALGAFPHAFDLEAARVVASPGPTAQDVVATLARLVDHGLVDFDGEQSYRLPFVARKFALDFGDGIHGLAAARERHARFFLRRGAEANMWGENVDPVSIDRLAIDLHAGLIWAMGHDPHLADRSFASFGVGLHGTVRRNYCDWVATRTDRDLDWAEAVGWLAILAPVDSGPVLDEAMRAAARIAAEAADAHLERLLACTTAQRATAVGDLRPARRLVDDACQADDGWIVVASATTAALIAATMGCFEDAEAFCTATKWACEQGGLAYAATGALLAEALMAHKSGRPGQAQSLIAEATDSPVMTSVVLGIRSVMAIDSGDLAALEMISEKLAAPIDAYGHLVRARAAFGVHLMSGDVTAAIGSAAAEIGSGPLEDAELLLLTAAAQLRNGFSLAEVRDNLDRARLAISLIAETCPSFEILLQILHAQTCLRENDLDGAGRHLYPALDQARAHRHRLLTIDVLETVAELSHRRGSATSANALQAACTRARTELGYNSKLLAPNSRLAPGPQVEAIDLDRALALAMRTRGGRRRPSNGIASLTPTETAVVDLVVAGRTNAQISTELVMSTATVKSHLTHVFAKLGVSNRTQLAVSVDRSRLPRHSG